MSYEQVICQTRGPVSWMTLNRPEVLNAFNTELGKQALEALRRALADDRTRVVVLTGKGRAFSVGADVNEPGTDNFDPMTVAILINIGLILLNCLLRFTN